RRYPRQGLATRNRICAEHGDEGTFPARAGDRGADRQACPGERVAVPFRSALARLRAGAGHDGGADRRGGGDSGQEHGRSPRGMSSTALPLVDPAPFWSVLQQAVRGEVRFDRLSRALYSTDASVYQIVPLGVVLPRTEDDILATLRTCARFGVP